MKGALASAAGDSRPARTGRRPGAPRHRAGRGIRGGGRAGRRAARGRGLRRRLRDHRRADRHACRRRRQGRRRDAPARRRSGCPRRDPWLGENAIPRAWWTCSALFSRYRLHALGASTGRRSTSAESSAGTPSTKCPTPASSTWTCATCPSRTPDAILDEVRGIPGATVVSTFKRPPAQVDPELPSCARCATRPRRIRTGETMSVGRDGASGTRCRSCARALSPRSSSGRSAPVTTGPRNGSR